MRTLWFIFPFQKQFTYHYFFLLGTICLHQFFSFLFNRKRQSCFIFLQNYMFYKFHFYFAYFFYDAVFYTPQEKVIHFCTCPSIEAYFRIAVL